MVNASYVHFPPEYRPQLNVSLPPKGDPKCCTLPEILPQFKFGEFPHYPLEMNTPVTLNGPTSTEWHRETGKFEADYEIPPRGQVPSAHAIRTWVRNFEETGSALKKKA
jgi:hypothetical protein